MIDIGKIAYDAYCEQVGWKSIHGENLPFWENQAESIRKAWTAAGDAVLKSGTASVSKSATAQEIAQKTENENAFR